MKKLNIKAGRRTIEIARPDKIFFPDIHLSKEDIINYYRDISDILLFHLKERPLSMQRFPDGITGEDFFQKEVPDYFPEWISRVQVKKQEGGHIEQVVCDNQEILIYLVDQACLVFHLWLSNTDNLFKPDRLIFDLDPAEDDFESVRFAARILYDFLTEKLKLTPFVKTTGSKGVHVVIPLDQSQDFDQVREFAKRVADIIADEHPDELTTEISRKKRGKRVYIDVARNGYAQTAVGAYSVRALPEAPIATPIGWDELWDKNVNARTYTVKNIFRRLGKKADPWKNMKRHAISPESYRERLNKYKSEKES
jgi:bifunctional non-homologous end joining protein LigD